LVKELVIIGFAEKYRALEVLPQLRRLRFPWVEDLQNAVAVEVEKDGSLRLFEGVLLDTAVGSEDATQWTNILSALVPPPHRAVPAPAIPGTEGHLVRSRVSDAAEQFFFEHEFVRNAAALLQPGNSALLVIVGKADEVLPVLAGYSHFVLRTSLHHREGS
jgi:uncharacterized membrane protein